MTTQSILGISKTPGQTQLVLQELYTLGFKTNDVSILMPDQSGVRDFVHEKNSKAPEGAVAGASAGGFAGGTIGLLVGLGSLVIPGLGPLIAVGPLLSALSGIAVGGAIGGVTGALVGLGIPEFEARLFEGKLREGNTLIAVHAENPGDVTRIRKVFTQRGIEDVGAAPEMPIPAAPGEGLGPLGPF